MAGKDKTARDELCFLVRAPVTFAGHDFRSGDRIPDDGTLDDNELRAALLRGDVEPVK